MARSHRVEGAFYETAARFVESCLRREGSLFTPEREIWSEACVGDLYERLASRREEGRGEEFLQRLGGALKDAPADVVQLAAEVLYVLLLAQDTGLLRKRENVVAVLGLCAEPVTLPDDLSGALAHGIASYGPALTQRFAQYIFLVEFAHAWRGCERAQRESLLLDPDRFRELVFSLPRKGASSQVEALLHIVFPDDFEPIVSAETKRKIADAFTQICPDESLPVDRRIALIRQELSSEYGERFSFYDPALRARWEDESPTAQAAQRAWLVRPVDHHGTNMLSQWSHEEFVSLGWPNSTRFDLGSSEREIRLELSMASPDCTQAQTRRKAAIIKRFISIAAGDLILIPDAEQLYVARASADVYWNDGEDASCLRRAVEWLNRDSPASRGALKDSAPGLYARLQTLLCVCELKDDLQTVSDLIGQSPEQPPPEEDEERPELEIAEGRLLPQATDELSSSLYLPRAWLQETIDLLEEKRQLILYGPPGTGKTFVAQALGEHIRSAGGDWQLVQFHPAYSYEDFFEGYRPSKPEDGGALQFNLRGGPLRLLAEQAMKNPHKPYLLVIDEINRGNIAKIFGELYFLLEYRDRPIRLQYSPEQPFKLPKNLFLIGTMNTADRSIALVDSALRRRFYFFALLPNESPVREVLALWLGERGFGQEASQLLCALNEELRRALPDEEFAIGPSYFMTKEGPPDLKRVWRHAISPLLEERFYGMRRADEIECEFGLEAIRKLLAGDDLKGEQPAESESETEAGQELSSLLFSK